MFDSKARNLHHTANLTYSEYEAAAFRFIKYSLATIQNVAIKTGKTGKRKRVLAEGPVTIAK